MNKIILTSLLCFSLLSACAANDGQGGRRSVDMTHVNSLNQQAEFRNIDIIWVNPPTEIETGTKTSIKIKIKMQGEDADPGSAAAEEKDPQQ
ncbi:MAG: hypothetical protein IIA76_05035 [Proteobacteria bacterium]|nr:hypothetical protein [Pseudomonadota bacterium]